VEPPLVLAPMAGVTRAAFRLLCREQGCGLVCSEMVSANGLVHGNRRTRELLAIAEGERPVSIQIFGRDPEAMAEAARIVDRAEPDLIDINMGCSVPKVAGTGAGAALLEDLDHAQEIVRAVAEAAARPVTVKMRARWKGTRDVAVEMARRAEQAGAAAVAIHPVPGRGERVLDWSLIAKAKQAVGIPVIGNGGVRTPHDAARMFAETGCDAVMVGRAALGNPWIFGRIAHALRTGEEPAAPSLEDRVAMAQRHGRLLAEQIGEERAAREMRTHLAWYLRAFRGAAQWRQRLHAVKRWGEVEGLLAELADEQGAARARA